jgi:hypothetical protein
MSKGKSYDTCRTCGSEVVETVNDSLFREGECDACEYLRYRTQSGLLRLARTFRSVCEGRISILENERAVLDADTEELDDQIAHWSALRERCERALAESAGTHPAGMSK